MRTLYWALLTYANGHSSCTRQTLHVGDGHVADDRVWQQSGVKVVLALELDLAVRADHLEAAAAVTAVHGEVVDVAIVLVYDHEGWDSHRWTSL